MIGVGSVKRFFVASHPVDFRKGHYGLLSEVRSLGLEPYQGDLVAFVSRDKRKIKALFGDSTGLTLLHKVFSTGMLRTHFRFLNDALAQEISHAELSLLFEGCSYTVHSKPQRWLPQSLANLTVP